MIWKSFMASLIILSLVSTGYTADPPKAPVKEKEKETAAALLASDNKVDGLELPADMTVPFDEGYIIVEATTKGQVKWLILGSTKVKYHEDGNNVVVSIPPTGGSINVYAVANIDGKLTDFARTSITIQGGIGPGPGPDPKPPVKPVKVIPKDAKLFVITILDFEAVTPELAKTVNDNKMRQAITAKGHDFKVYNVKDKIIDSANLRKAVNDNNGKPVILLMDQKSGVVYDISLVPGTAEELLNYVNSKLGGQ